MSSEGKSGRGGIPVDRVDVSWAWSGGAPHAFRLLRRPGTHPVDPDEGYVVVDSSDLFRASDEPWERVSRVRYVVGEGGTEGGLVSAALAFFHDVPGASVPVRVELDVLGESGEHVATWRSDEVTRTRVTPRGASAASVDALEIFHASDVLGERSAGVVTVTEEHGPSAARAAFRWEPAEGRPTEVPFDRAVLARTRAEVRRPSDVERIVVWLRTLRVDGEGLAEALRDPEEVEPSAVRTAVITLREELSPYGASTRSFVVSDLTAPADETSCYTLFVEDATSPTGWVTERGWKATAGGGGPRGFADPLLGGLPSVQHYVDRPAPHDRDDRGDGRGNGRGDGRVGSPASRSTR